MQTVKADIEIGKEIFEGFVKNDFTSTNILSATTDTLPAPSNDFGEALLNDLGEQGDIIATYVGAMSGRGFDSTGIFGTGYLSDFDVTVVYSDGNQVMIVSTEVVVPWYTNSTNQSQYNEFVSENGRYQLSNTETTTITAPVYVAGEATL